MARGSDRDRGSKRAPKEAARRGRKKVCVFCKGHVEWVDYKDVNLLRRYMSDRGKIRARRVSGNCAQHQREVATAIKTARELALLPYTQRTVNERAGRGQRGGPPIPRPPIEAVTEAEVPPIAPEAEVDEEAQADNETTDVLFADAGEGEGEDGSG